MAPFSSLFNLLLALATLLMTSAHPLHFTKALSSCNTKHPPSEGGDGSGSSSRAGEPSPLGALHQGPSLPIPLGIKRSSLWYSQLVVWNEGGEQLSERHNHVTVTKDKILPNHYGTWAPGVTECLKVICQQQVICQVCVGDLSQPTAKGPGCPYQ